MLFAGATKYGSVTVPLLSAMVAGGRGGMFSPLFASLTRKYFCERRRTPILAKSVA